jgi:hypothetical protein
MTEQETSRGRTRITPRAFNRIVAAVAAQSLDVTPNEVGVRVARANGRVELAVSAPIPAAMVVDRLQEQIRQYASTITGSDIDLVSVRSSSALLAATPAGRIVNRVREKYRQAPVRIVGLAAAGLTSAGIVAVAVARAFARK